MNYGAIGAAIGFGIPVLPFLIAGVIAIRDKVKANREAEAEAIAKLKAEARSRDQAVKAAQQAAEVAQKARAAEAAEAAQKTRAATELKARALPLAQSYFRCYGDNGVAGTARLFSSVTCEKCGGRGTYFEAKQSVSVYQTPTACSDCKGTGKVTCNSVEATVEDVNAYFDEPCEVTWLIAELAKRLTPIPGGEFFIAELDGGKDSWTSTDYNEQIHEYTLCIFLTDKGEFKATKRTIDLFWLMGGRLSKSNKFREDIVTYNRFDELMIEFDFSFLCDVYNFERDSRSVHTSTYHLAWNQIIDAHEFYKDAKRTIRRHYKKGYGLLAALEAALKKLAYE